MLLSASKKGMRMEGDLWKSSTLCRSRVSALYTLSCWPTEELRSQEQSKVDRHTGNWGWGERQTARERKRGGETDREIKDKEIKIKFMIYEGNR